MPSEIIAQMQRRHLNENPFLNATLKWEFLVQLPAYSRDPLLLIGKTVNLGKMGRACGIADALVGDL